MFWIGNFESIDVTFYYFYKMLIQICATFLNGNSKTVTMKHLEWPTIMKTLAIGVNSSDGLVRRRIESGKRGRVDQANDRVIQMVRQFRTPDWNALAMHLNPRFKSIFSSNGLTRNVSLTMHMLMERKWLLEDAWLGVNLINLKPYTIFSYRLRFRPLGSVFSPIGYLMMRMIHDFRVYFILSV